MPLLVALMRIRCSCRRVGCLRACRRVGSLAREQANAPNFNGQLASVSYTPFDGSAHPDSGTRTTAAQIRADLKAIAPYTRMVRTYSSTGGTELVPRDRRRVRPAGLDRRLDRQGRPSATSARCASVIDLARRSRNIDSIVVGNETIYRGEQTAEELIRRSSASSARPSLPVTTGEIWHVWIEHPELVSAVDFIAAHVLPYWEGISDKAAVDHTIMIYNQLRQAYPGKRIVIAEFGWPSAGYNRRDADPGPLAQAAGAARLRQPRRGARHRLQHHRSLRPAVEDLRRRRRPLLGHVRHRRGSRSSPGPGRSPIPITGSSPASPC